MSGSRRARLQTDGPAQALGQASELGEYRRSYAFAYRSARRGWGLLLAVVGLLPGLSIASAGAQRGYPVMFAVPATLVALGAVLVMTAPREKADRIHLYSGGIAQVTGSGQVPLVIHWSQLGQLWVEYPQDAESPPPSPVAIRLSGGDGTVITVGPGYGPGTLRQLRDRLSRVVIEARLPAATRQASKGVPVHFGGLSVSQVGIAWGGGTSWAGWRDIRAIRVTPCRIELETAAPPARQQIWLSDVPDACVAVLLVQELAGTLGVQQKGPPVTAPPAMPGIA
jgi:hypothetical protein